jgi:hypothetical protein
MSKIITYSLLFSIKKMSVYLRIWPHFPYKKTTLKNLRYLTRAFSD